MSPIELLLLSVALAMDCFTVSIACGIIQRRMGRQALCMAFLFGLFQALMPLVGWFVGGMFNRQIEAYDHWVAFGVLSFLGCKMIREGCRADKRQQAAFNPSNAAVLLTLSVATSIDAMAVGITFWSMDVRTLPVLFLPLLSIGMASFLLTLVGKYIGVRLGHRFDWPAEQLGGGILIFIALKVLVQHLWQ